MEINAKRVQRLWREEGLRVPRRQRKRARLGKSENGTQRLSAERVNHVWSYDFVMDQTEDGRRLKWLPICDEFSRELVALEVERRMEATDVIRILDEAVIARGCVPEYIRSDNGPEFVALAVQQWIEQRGFKTLYIKPGSPWQNAYSESFNSRFRDEFLNREAFASVLEAKVLGKEHQQRHNHERSHSSLKYQTPVEFAQRSLAAASATLRQPQGCALPADQQTHNSNPENQQKLSQRVDQSSGAGQTFACHEKDRKRATVSRKANACDPSRARYERGSRLSALTPRSVVRDFCKGCVAANGGSS